VQSNPNEMPARPGRIRQPDNLANTLREAEDWHGTSWCRARIISVVLRSAPSLPTLGHGPRLLLCRLVEATTDADWRAGRPRVWERNDRLATDLGAKVRTVQTWIAELAEAGLLYRETDHLNRRTMRAAIDLRPLGAALERLEAELTQRTVAADDADRERRQVAPIDSSWGESISTHNYKPQTHRVTDTPLPKNVVDLADIPGAPRTEAEAATFLRSLWPALANATAEKATPDEIGSAIQGLARETVPLHRSVWGPAFRRHGSWTVWAALVLTSITPSLDRPAGYARNMLQKARADAGLSEHEMCNPWKSLRKIAAMRGDKGASVTTEPDVIDTLPKASAPTVDKAELVRELVGDLNELDLETWFDSVPDVRHQAHQLLARLGGGTSRRDSTISIVRRLIKLRDGETIQ